ncbi:Hypothetical protein BQ3484_250 [Cedratvirus A11]|uniref:Uncharacterized protein n=1 Tax=Cedratvirus A11 TaxID=1903266 RepID=A0A1M7XUW1_9VIRU|nr:Hypothetical protein BQ3484_250 [Cedratvirus A11]SHO33318.1 Hypothetical protein BQ3484_250 [Cedratvirus A11]
MQVETLEACSLFEFFVCADMSSDLPELPVEIKQYICDYTCYGFFCYHGCSKVMWKRFGKGGKKCCFCSDERPVKDVYTCKDAWGKKRETKDRYENYCIICKRLAERGQGPK